MSLRGRWFLANYGILYAIAFVGGCAVAAAHPGDFDSSGRWSHWALGVPVLGLLGIGFTIFFTLPAFTLYLVGLRLARRYWPRRATAWILTPLLTWAVIWTWSTEGEGSWWNFAIALLCVAAAAALVRV